MTPAASEAGRDMRFYFSKTDEELVAAMAAGKKLTCRWEQPANESWLLDGERIESPSMLASRHLVRQYPSTEKYVLNYCLRDTKHVRSMLAALRAARDQGRQG